jgi:hypothetical protein
MSGNSKAPEASNTDELFNIRLPDQLVAAVMAMVRCMETAHASAKFATRCRNGL